MPIVQNINIYYKKYIITFWRFGFAFSSKRKLTISGQEDLTAKDNKEFPSLSIALGPQLHVR